MQNHEEGLFKELVKIYEESMGNKMPELVHYETGQEIFEQGEVPKGVFYIKNGNVKIIRNNHEQPVVVRLAGSNELMGYLSLIKRWDYDSTATTIEPCEIYFIPKQLFLKAVEDNVAFTNIVLDILCSRINEKNELITELITKSVQERLAVLLLTLDRNLRDGNVTYYKKDIAAILNIKAETLSRNLLSLEKKGAIKLHPKTNSIEIKSRQKLLELSHITD